MSEDKMPTELDDYRPVWRAMTAKCSLPCGTEWAGVAHRDATNLECPSCREMSGAMLSWDTELRTLKDARIEASLVDDGEP